MKSNLRSRALVPLAALGVVAASACAGPAHPAGVANSSAPPAPAATTTSAAPTTTAPRGPIALPTCDPVAIPPLDASNFTAPTKIDNQWMPLVPGTRTVLEGRANSDGTTLPHRIVFTVTDLVKVINGVPNLVTWDVDYNRNQVAEAELAFFAQDNDKNVWNFGEYPEEYTDGTFSGAPRTWLGGLSTASAGVQVPATPRLDQAAVLQGSSPGTHFLDCTKDHQTGQHVCVPTGCYDNVRVTDETSPLDPNSGTQRKYYAPGVGNIQVAAIDDPEGETLVQVERSTLSPAELTTARQAAMALDQHGRVAHSVYSVSQPIEAK